MPTATATKPKPKTTPAEDEIREIPARLRAAHRKSLRDALTKWRSWALAAANNGTVPDPGELLTVATLLRIPSPAAALAEDAKAITDERKWAAQRERDKAHGAELLAPWGGDLSKLDADIDAAKREVERLQAIRGYCPWSGHYRNQVRMKNKRMFADAAAVVADLERYQ